MTIRNYTVERGNTFNGARFTIRVNGQPLDLTGASIAVQFRTRYLAKPALELSVGKGITISDAPAGQFWIDPQIFYIPVEQYQYRIRIELANGVTKTWIGGTFTITEDWTRER